MSSLSIVWSILLTIFVGIPGLYYLYMRSFLSKPWRVWLDKSYYPMVSILIPTYNEERMIRLKLENLIKLDYPRDRLQIIVVNDGSTDNTLHEVNEFQGFNSGMNIEVLDCSKRMGKTVSLNSALNKARGEIIVVSDADCFLSSNILLEALPFLVDSSVGAVTGLEALLNPKESWVTETETLYNNTIHTIRVGESKVHSTIIFQGGFSAYKRSLLVGFDVKADDSGTALNIVQKGSRTILLPEAIYFTVFPTDWMSKFLIKLRRASQLVQIWFDCLKLFLRGRLLLPKKIFVSETFLYLVNPLVFVFLIGLSFLTAIENPLWLLVFSVFLAVGLAISRLRTILVEALQDHLVLLCAIFSSVFGRGFSSWSTSRGSRVSVTREMLERRNLV